MRAEEEPGRPRPTRVPGPRPTSTWTAFDRLLAGLDQRGIDPHAFLAVLVKCRPSGRPVPMPTMLISDWAWRHYETWNSRTARRYPNSAAGARQETVGRLGRLLQALAEGRAIYERLPVKDLPRLVHIAAGVLPPEFFLVSAAVRFAAQAGTAPGEICAAWKTLREWPAAIEALDSTAREIGGA